jgi:hypothetical protein
MSLKTVIVGLAAAAIVAGSALMPTRASAQHGGHGGGGFHAGGAVHVGGGFGRGFAMHPRGGIGYRGYGYRGYGYRGGWGGLSPWWGVGIYPGVYYSGPSCGYVHVTYHRYGRVHWRLVYRCW